MANRSFTVRLTLWLTSAVILLTLLFAGNGLTWAGSPSHSAYQTIPTVTPADDGEAATPVPIPPGLTEVQTPLPMPEAGPDLIPWAVVLVGGCVCLGVSVSVAAAGLTLGVARRKRNTK